MNRDVRVHSAIDANEKADLDRRRGPLDVSTYLRLLIEHARKTDLTYVELGRKHVP